MENGRWKMHTAWATAKCGIPLILEKATACLPASMPRFDSPVGNRMSLGPHEFSERWEEGAGSWLASLAAHVDLRTCAISAGRQLGNRENVKSAIPPARSDRRRS